MSRRLRQIDSGATLTVMDDGEGRWNLWIAAQRGDPTRQNESFIVGSGPTDEHAMEDGLRTLDALREELVDMLKPKLRLQLEPEPKKKFVLVSIETGRGWGPPILCLEREANLCVTNLSDLNTEAAFVSRIRVEDE